MLSKTNRPISMWLMKKEYGSLINLDNIEKLSKFSIKKIFINEELELKNMFLHKLLSEWIKKKKVHDDTFFRTLKKLVKKTGIELSTEDEHDLFLLEERIFSKERHIKTIDVNFKLNPKEIVGIKYLNSKLYLKTSKKLVEYISGELLVSNQRIIILNEKRSKSFLFKEINDHNYLLYGFQFAFKKSEYVLRIHDQITLNNTLENLINKKVKKWN